MNWIESLLLPNDNPDDDDFGFAISVAGHTAVVGAINDVVDGVESGAAYVFQLRGGSWQLVQKLLPSTRQNNQRFGYAVSLDGHRLAISAVSETDINFPARMGAVYVYQLINGTWTETDHLFDNDLFDMGFGRSLKLSGEHLLVGDYNAFTDQDNDGRAYLYTWNNGAWSVQHTFESALADNHFAFSVDLQDNLVLIGSEFANEAFVYENLNGQWQETQRLTHSNPGQFDRFGRSVLIHNNQLFIAAFRHDADMGAVYVFARDVNDDWVEVQKLTPADGDSTDYFGTSLAAAGNQLIIGSPSSSTTSVFESGSAYLFEHDNNQWLETHKFIASDAEFNDRFGDAVAMAGPFILIAALQDDEAGPDAGSVYVYDATVDLIFQDGF